MEDRFCDKATRALYNGEDSKITRKLLPGELRGYAVIQLDRVLNASRIEDLRQPPSNKLEALKDDRKGQFSIRINRTYRVCFMWDNEEGAYHVEIVDYH